MTQQRIRSVVPENTLWMHWYNYRNAAPDLMLRTEVLFSRSEADGEVYAEQRGWWWLKSKPLTLEYAKRLKAEMDETVQITIRLQIRYTIPSWYDFICDFIAASSKEQSDGTATNPT